MTLINAHSLFVGSRKIEAYHQAISRCEVAHARLVAADKKIRKTLRIAAEAVLDSKVELHRMVENAFLKDHDEIKFELRFLWQGSKVYRTDIDPAQKPPQQCDLDDGIYLRTSFFGITDPAIASERFFHFVEKALTALCEQEGWRLITSKDTCVRIELDDELHLDFPLYAIPDDEFTKLEKAALCTFDHTFSEHGNVLKMFDVERSLRIRQDRVMLAHRKQGWIQSDPRALHDWFEEWSTHFGPQLKRQCRYLKGWRDFIFPKGGPESITLMVCVVMVFQESFHEFDSDRDDVAFLKVSERLADLFRSDIENPVLPGADGLLNKWDDIERQKFIGAANSLAYNAREALTGTYDANTAIDKFVESLGNRFPRRPDLVEIRYEAKSAIAAPNVIAPIVPVASTISG